MINSNTTIIENYLIQQSHLINKYYNKKPKNISNSNNYAVIIEPRSEHHLLDAVCKNVMYFLPSDWNLIVYSFDENKVREKIKNIDFIFYKTSKSSFTLEEYSDLMMTEEFWNNIPGENVLIFQTDSYITRYFTNDYINKLIKYPFVGSVYKIVDFKNKCDCCAGRDYCDKNIISFDENRNFSMSGGFSFRNKRAMIDCIRRVSKNDIIDYKIKHNQNVILPFISYEDSYFENALFLLNYELPDKDTCLEFCLEAIYKLTNSYARHGINKDFFKNDAVFHLAPGLMELNEEIDCKIKYNI